MKIGTVDITLWSKENSYNNASNTERMVEIPLAEWFIKKYGNQSFMEIGAVSPYYFDISHHVFDITDPYEHCLKINVKDISYTNTRVLSISTIEHMGKKDYNLPEVPGLAIEVLQKMMSANIYLITFASAYNLELDSYVETLSTNVIRLHRTEFRIWEEVKSLDGVLYNAPLPCGNGLYIITNCQELLQEQVTLKSQTVQESFSSISLRLQHQSTYDEIITANQYKTCPEDFKDRSIIDIGANNGVFTLLANSCNAKRVVSVESNFKAYELLSENVRNSKSNIIHIINKAVDKRSGLKISIGRKPEFSPYDGRCFVEQIPESKDLNSKEIVETISFHNLLDNIDKFDNNILLKMDCEGSEYNIIYGASIEDIRRCSTILIEIHENFGASGSYKIQSLCDYLNGIGYTSKWKSDITDEIKLFRFDRDHQIEDCTVIISEYLRPELLLEQIEAFRAQSFKPKEIIVWQTQVKEYINLYALTKDFPEVHIIKTEYDFSLPSRFAISLMSKTPYVYLTDDDMFPGPRYLEECYKLSKTNNSVISPYGIVYIDNTNESKSTRYGEGDIHTKEAVKVDMGGQGWFGKREWFSYFWSEPVIDDKISDDIHFSYTLKKYAHIDIMAAPWDDTDTSTCPNTKKDAGLGCKSLHARKWDEPEVWKNVSISAIGDWGGQSQEYLADNLYKFVDRRAKISEIYQEKLKALPQVQVVLDKIKPAVSDQVTCVISTKDRYFTTLPLTILSIINQTVKPKELLIYDDGEHKDLRGEPIYQHLFASLDYYGIVWSMTFGDRTGQVTNHIKSLSKATTPFIWRCDDDDVPEPDTLAKLLKHMDPDVGAVGGLVLHAPSMRHKPSIASNAIEDIFLGLNEQWFLQPPLVKEVDHLYNSFLYRREAAVYNRSLSTAGHREETLLTYEMKCKGWKILLDTSIQTWHFAFPAGGIRTAPPAGVAQDERVFLNKMRELKVTPNDYSFVILDNGLGDHYAFKSMLKPYFRKFQDKTHIFFTCFPEAFQDVPGIKQASIADAQALFPSREQIDQHNIYKWAIDTNWKGPTGSSKALQSIPAIYKHKMCLQGPFEFKQPIKGSGSTIFISPYSQHRGHPKSYPYWSDLVQLLKSQQYTVVQLGRLGEEIITGVDDYKQNLPLVEIQNLLSACKTWISVDNFLPHLANCITCPSGIVIFGLSDPQIYGYDYNLNILKDRSFLRPDQFGSWFDIKPNLQAYKSGREVFEQILTVL